MDARTELCGVGVEGAVDEGGGGSADQDSSASGKGTCCVGDDLADSSGQGETIEHCQWRLALFKGEHRAIAGTASQATAIDDRLGSTSGGAEGDALAGEGQVLEVGPWSHEYRIEQVGRVDGALDGAELVRNMKVSSEEAVGVK